MIRKMNPNRALDILAITPKAAAKDLAKVIGTALANAKQEGISLEKVGFKKIEVNEGMRLKRFRAGTRGRVKPYKRRMSNIKVVLTDGLKLKAQKSKVKTEKENPNSRKENMMDDSADKTKSTEGGMTESSK